MHNKNKTGTTVANNTPVGSAGQPFNFNNKKVSETKSAAIKRRMAKKKEETGSKNNGN